ncbi:histidine kinase [Ruania suaedae]|uniref:sensor histidine kinase n=1 Tax=Ruania suaedae TaxID=2897774 RepID=UPI001E3AAC67|nr:histidine kinase [Ruania suaedae]UFU03240.1 histidine kinase [Ruania suaedae]
MSPPALPAPADAVTDPARPSPETARRSRRRFRALNLATTAPMLVAVGSLLAVREAQTWIDGVVLGLGVLAVLVVFERWTAGEVGRLAVLCLTITAAVWAYGALLIGADVVGSFYPVVVTGPLVISRLRARRLLAGAILTGYVAVVGVLGLLLSGGTSPGAVIGYVILPVGLAAILIGLMVPNQGFYDVVADLEEAREREAELAVVRERVRFASELHDIQGHTLHVVKLKIALAERLLATDDGRDAALAELAEVRALVATTIEDTRDLAYGRRRLNLVAELENARHLFEATGIAVRVERRGEVDTSSTELLAQVLREATTNILRHSRARSVRIDLSARAISIVNDGAVVADEGSPSGDGELELRGLATLAGRVAEQGGRLEVDRSGDHFRVVASFAGVARGGSA